MRLNIDRDLVKQLTGQRTASKNTSRRWVDLWVRDVVMWYWLVAILFWQLSIDHFVNDQYTRCGLAKTLLRHPSIPFDSLPYPTLTICRRVRAYARSITWQPNEKRLTIFYEYGALKRSWQPRYYFFIFIGNSTHGTHFWIEVQSFFTRVFSHKPLWTLAPLLCYLTWHSLFCRKRR